ncbi:MAG: hypothetical protein KGI38_03830 [Thaumarchaeota archaeon]|nr:hypothetical protein [Nitrososphaerota archaeon]
MNTRPSRLYLGYERNTMSIVFSQRKYATTFLILSALVSVFYLFLLPSLPDGTFTLYAIAFIAPLQVAFAFVFGILFSLVIVLNVYSFKIRAAGAKGLTIGSILASLVNGLCCTPLIPTLLALFGASTPVLFEYSPGIQAFFEFNYPYFYLLSALALLVSVHYLSKNISCCKLVKAA